MSVFFKGDPRLRDMQGGLREESPAFQDQEYSGQLGSDQFRDNIIPNRPAEEQQMLEFKRQAEMLHKSEAKYREEIKQRIAYLVSLL